MSVCPCLLPRSLACLIVCGLLPSVAAAATPDRQAEPDRAQRQDADYQQHVRPFLARHCFGCHGAEDGKAGLTLHDLGTDFTAGTNADLWKEVIDRINLGEMPPEDAPRPDPDEAFRVVQWVARQLGLADRQARLGGGRALLRRLNRREYINTVRDLLALDENIAQALMETLPADGKAEGFDRVSAALFIDATQMQAYLAAGEAIAAAAIVDGPPPEAATIDVQAEQVTRAEREMHQDTLFGGRVEYPRGVAKYEVRADGVLHIQSNFGFGDGPKIWGRFHQMNLDALVTQDGYYRFRIKAGASRGGRDEPVRIRIHYAQQTPVESEEIVVVDHPLDAPGIIETIVYLRAGEPGQTRRLSLQWNGLPEVIRGNQTWYSTIKNPSRNITRDIAAAKSRGDAAAVDALYRQRDELMRKAEAFDEPFFSYVGDYAQRVDEIPKLYFDSLEIEGPVQPMWPPRSHQQLLGDADIDRPDLATAHEVFERLLPRAYRRPVTTAEVDRIVAIVADGLNRHGMEFTAAIRLGLQAVLCSPQFLYIAEPAAMAERPRRLNDYELAARLSYFLWSTMPDETLFRLAAEGRLRDPGVLRNQAVRMLDDPRARQFVESFAGQWLSVDQFGSVAPANQYRDYDQQLEEASKREPLEFFAEVLRSDLPITAFLDSDFLMINQRLARHYGIAGVTGDQFRKVAITAEHHRGGVLGMAGLMTLLADGTRTLPVRRAAWITENLFNDPPPPPPPNAGEVQPNSSGENLTVRERLARHRDEPTCASCHTRLDPYGLALENYDAIGAWRLKANGENFRASRAPELDVSGTLPSGRSFDDLAGFKAALLAETPAFAEALSEKMLTYALGRPVGYVDRKSIDQLVAALDQNDYRIRSLILAVVTSDAFQTK